MPKPLPKGVFALFTDPEQLKLACSQIRDLKVKKFDAYTPFPVHGIEDAMGLKRSFLPWVTFLAGLTGGTIGLTFEWWVSAVDWPLNVGGKPMFSLPAFIPITFECTVLFAGLATAATMLLAAKLPAVDPPILDPSLTNDKFGIFISAADPQFREKDFSDILKKAGANEVRVY